MLKFFPDDLEDIKRYFSQGISNFPRFIRAIKELDNSGVERCKNNFEVSAKTIEEKKGKGAEFFFFERTIESVEIIQAKRRNAETNSLGLPSKKKKN